jgi:hypothetical protein
LKHQNLFNPHASTAVKVPDGKQKLQVWQPGVYFNKKFYFIKIPPQLIASKDNAGLPLPAFLFIPKWT